MSRKIRVLEMIDDASLGGGQVHVALLAKHLPKDEFDVTIATEPRGFLVEEARRLGVRCEPIEISNRLSWRSFHQVQSVLSEGRFDILHTHGGTAGMWGRTASFVTRSPRVRIHTYHGLHYLSKGHPFRIPYSVADRIALPLTTKIICVCRSDLNKGIAHHVVEKEKAVVIYNGIDIAEFVLSPERERIRKEQGATEGDIILGTVGRLHPQKAPEVLLGAFQKVIENVPNARLWFVGDGELRPKLEQIVSTLGIEKQVKFLGARRDIAALLSALDIFVLPSLWEGQPIALLEAMAAGKAIVSTKVDGVPEILEHEKSGLLVQPGDESVLAASILRLVCDSSLRRQLATRAAERIAGDFSAQQMAKNVAGVYRECLKP